MSNKYGNVRYRDVENKPVDSNDSELIFNTTTKFITKTTTYREMIIKVHTAAEIVLVSGRPILAGNRQKILKMDSRVRFAGQQQTNCTSQSQNENNANARIAEIHPSR